MSYQTIGTVAEHDVLRPPAGSAWKSIWANNKGACLILLAQMSGASMDAMARYLEQGETRFHPFQVQILPFFCHA